MSGGKTAKDLLKVAFSNIIVLLSGIAVSIFLPKIISVAQYSDYKIFTLYSSYVGLILLGVNDGIYIKYSGLAYDSLDKSRFRTYSRYILLLAFAFAFCFLAASLFVGEEYSFLLLALGLYVVPFSLVGYYQQISQMTQRFNEYSVLKIINSVLSIVAVAMLFVLSYVGADKLVSDKTYVLSVIVIYAVLMVWYLVKYKDVTFGRAVRFREEKKEIFALHRLGIPLLIANLISILLLNIDRQFVSIFFDKTTYAMYAFAYNIMSMITTVISAVSIVVFPILKQSDDEKKKAMYDKLVCAVVLLSLACLAVYYPFTVFVGWFLPSYVDSLPVLQCILPSIVFNSAINLIIYNYYKAMNKTKRFLYICIGMLVLSVALNAVAVFAFRSVIYVSAATIITMLVWFFVASVGLKRECGMCSVKNVAAIIVGSAAFYLTSIFLSWYLGLIVYLAAVAAVAVITFGRDALGYVRERKQTANDTEKTE